ncbi:MAG: hypothetical protein H9534_15400 [Dolichospermum circinale Clear-D4]|nr:hypothetical protein [Dolichospermum circinale Clear-D4]
MSFNTFKSISAVLEQFPIIYQEESIVQEKTLQPSPYFIDRLQSVLTEGVVFNSEYAICENIISPILTEVWQNYKTKCLLWSHQFLNYDEVLSGVPDYMIAKRSPRGKIFLERPILVAIEAKKDNFEEGWGQCLAELIAIQKINQFENEKAFGIVTNGKLWEFAQLQKNIFTKNIESFLLDNLPKLISVINFIFGEATQQI